MEQNKKEKKVVYQGDLFRLTSTAAISKKNEIRIFEKAHRPPGVRMLFRRGNEILLTEEKRRELGDWDFRLPGGKVFDDFSSFSASMDSEKLMDEKIREAVVFESKEEVGMIVHKDKVKKLHKSVAGSSVIWDLFYFEIKDFEYSKSGQDLEEGEEIKPPKWYSFDEVKAKCLNGEISEDRTVSVLLKYILNDK